jgi:hypothetical protein
MQFILETVQFELHTNDFRAYEVQENLYLGVRKRVEYNSSIVNWEIGGGGQFCMYFPWKPETEQQDSCFRARTMVVQMLPSGAPHAARGG